MPKRLDIKKILIIGAGPIVIGQACEFDYSGAQACKSLRDEGYEVILINSNPATFMTDPELANKTYIEPINKKYIEEIIKLEKPDALLPTMGGQTALNVSIELYENKILEKYNIKMIGANPIAIELAEDRQKFKDAMREIGLSCPKSTVVKSIKEAEKVIKPAINFLLKNRCKKIILACTELPVAIFAYKSFKKVKSSKTFLDPNLILAKASMKRYKS